MPLDAEGGGVQCPVMDEVAGFDNWYLVVFDYFFCPFTPLFLGLSNTFFLVVSYAGRLVGVHSGCMASKASLMGA